MSSTNKSQISMLNPNDRSKKFFQKKLVVVNADFQFRYVRIALIIGIVSTLLTAVILLYPLYVFEYLRIPRALPAPVIWGTAVALLLNIASISMVGLMISHKIAGPMYAICRNLRSIEVGDWSSKLTLRKNDELSYIARNLNRVVDSLVITTEEDIQTIQEIEDALKQNNSEQALKVINTFKDSLKNRIYADKE